MNWTKETPKVDGCYWVTINFDAPNVRWFEIVKVDHGRIYTHGSEIADRQLWYEQREASWYGPIPIPSFKETRNAMHDISESDCAELFKLFHKWHLIALNKTCYRIEGLLIRTGIWTTCRSACSGFDAIRYAIIDEFEMANPLKAIQKELAALVPHAALADLHNGGIQQNLHLIPESTWKQWKHVCDLLRKEKELVKRAEETAVSQWENVHPKGVEGIAQGEVIVGRFPD